MLTGHHLNRYRKFKGEFRTAESVGFVDGSLVQTFVGLDSAHLDMVMKGQNEAQALTDSVAQLSDAVEDLSRAHS